LPSHAPEPRLKLVRPDRARVLSCAVRPRFRVAAFAVVVVLFHPSRRNHVVALNFNGHARDA